jgi:hypothetical protein
MNKTFQDRILRQGCQEQSVRFFAKSVIEVSRLILRRDDVPTIGARSVVWPRAGL